MTLFCSYGWVIFHCIFVITFLILHFSKLKWTGMGEFNSDGHYVYYYGQESLRRNEVAIIVNKRVWNAVLGCNLKNNRIISVHFQGKPFSVTVIQVYALTSNAEEAEVEWFYEDLQDFLELTPKKDVLFIIRDWNVNEAGQRLTEFCQENALVIENTLFAFLLFHGDSLDSCFLYNVMNLHP